MTRQFLEVACFNEQSALNAEISGANRIELCQGADFGGTTPNLNSFKKLRPLIKLPIFVMIRARGGNFVYSSEELAQMKADLMQFKNAGADGFVFGILNQNKNIDRANNQLLIELANGLPCTFHRAFDESSDYEQNLKDTVSCGFQTILSSGCRGNAVDGLASLSHLIELAKGKITIMPGGGVRSSNIQYLAQTLQTNYFHSSALVNSTYADINEIRNIMAKLQ